jgi:predicted RNase H-like nuclease (RuvC/YqgF family)
MKLTTLIPPEYRMMAALAAVALFAVATFGAGWTVSRWRADAHYATEISSRDTTISDLRVDVGDRETSIATLKGDIKTQNEKIAALGKESEAIAEQQRLAVARAEEAARASASRVATLQRRLAEGATPEQALQDYWEMSR